MPHSDHGDQHAAGDFFPPPTKPRTTKGGIRLQSGARERTWWSQRWMAALEATGTADRMSRGLDYARSGQVLTLEFELGRVCAVVQGTRRDPYELSITVSAIEQLDWLQVARAVADRASARAALTSGKMPDEIEALCARVGVRLFPEIESDLTCACTCSDWAVPCKHVAAVCHLVGEAFDQDPMLVLRVRGIERDVLLAMVGGVDIIEQAPVDKELREGGLSTDGVDVGRFWGASTGEGQNDLDLVVDVQPPVRDAPLVRILGAPSMWRGTEDFVPVVGRMYERIASDERVIDLALGVDPGWDSTSSEG